MSAGPEDENNSDVEEEQEQDDEENEDVLPPERQPDAYRAPDPAVKAVQDAFRAPEPQAPAAAAPKGPKKWQQADTTDYPAIRRANGTPDPFELYYRDRYEPTPIMNAAGGMRNFFLLSPIKDPATKHAVHKVQYVVGVDIGDDEVTRLRQHFGKSKNPEDVAAEVAAPENELAAAESQQPQPQARRGPSAAATEAIQSSLGLNKSVRDIAEDPFVSNAALPYTKVTNQQPWMQEFFTQQVGFHKALQDIGLHALQLAFEASSMTVAESRATLEQLSFRNEPEKLVDYVTQHLNNAVIALKQNPEEFRQRAREEVALHIKMENQLERTIGKLDKQILRLTTDLDIATLMMTPAMEAQFETYRRALKADPLYGLMKVKRALIDSRLAALTGAPPNGHPMPPGPAMPPTRMPVAHNIPPDLQPRLQQLTERVNQIVASEFNDLSPDAVAAHQNRLARAQQQQQMQDEIQGWGQ